MNIKFKCVSSWSGKGKVNKITFRSCSCKLGCFPLLPFALKRRGRFTVFICCVKAAVQSKIHILRVLEGYSHVDSQCVKVDEFCSIYNFSTFFFFQTSKQISYWSYHKHSEVAPVKYNPTGYICMRPVERFRFHFPTYHMKEIALAATSHVTKFLYFQFSWMWGVEQIHNLLSILEFTVIFQHLHFFCTCWLIVFSIMTHQFVVCCIHLCTLDLLGTFSVAFCKRRTSKQLQCPGLNCIGDWRVHTIMIAKAVLTVKFSVIILRTRVWAWK